MIFAWEFIINIYKLTSLAVTKMHYLAYWKEDSGGNAASTKGDRGIQGKHCATGEAGTIDIGDRDRGGARPSGPKGERGVAGWGKSNVCLHGPKGYQGARGPIRSIRTLKACKVFKRLKVIMANKAYVV